MKKFIIFSMLFIFGISISCSDEMSSPTKIRELNEFEKNLVKAGNVFGYKLFRQINEAEGDRNVFISPLSVSLALGMTLNGANGETEEAMQATLELTGMNMEQINESYQSLMDLLINLDPKVIFEIANSIWYFEGFHFEQEFIQLNQTYFDAQVEGLNFHSADAASRINQWVSEHTHGKIQTIVDDEIPLDMVMYLINAIYFKGTWTYEFDKSKTQDDVFHLADGSPIPCSMMNQGGNFLYKETERYQAVDLPYGDGDFSMLVLLPRPDVTVESLVAELDQLNWSDMRQLEGTLQLPKFKLEYELVLNDVLKALGMAVAFDPSRADFTGMCKDGGLSISEVKHKTFVEVNEEGTEAAAVTSVGIKAVSVGPAPFALRVDRPFIVIIKENRSDTILFMGKIMQPK